MLSEKESIKAMEKDARLMELLRKYDEQGDLTDEEWIEMMARSDRACQM